MNKNHETWMLCVLVCFNVIVPVRVWLFHFPIGKWLPQHSPICLSKTQLQMTHSLFGNWIIGQPDDIYKIYVSFMFQIKWNFIYFLSSSTIFKAFHFSSILSSHKFPIVIWFYFSWCFCFSLFLVIVLFMIGLWFNFLSLLVTKWT